MAIDHVSFGSNDIARARSFYLATLAPLGLRIVAEVSGHYCDFGFDTVSFSIETPVNGKRPTAGNGTHVCFRANSRAQVEAFYAAAIGRRRPGRWQARRVRPHYSADYFSAFVFDLDGNKIEAVCYSAAC